MDRINQEVSQISWGWFDFFFEGLNFINSTRITTENRGKFGTKLPRTSAMLAICCYRRIFPEEIQGGGKGDVHRDTVGGWRGVTFLKWGFSSPCFFFYVKPGEKSWWFGFFVAMNRRVVPQASKLFSVFFARISRISHMIPTCLIVEVEWMDCTMFVWSWMIWIES